MSLNHPLLQSWFVVMMLFACAPNLHAERAKAMSAPTTSALQVKRLEVIAALPIRPGNVAATPQGRVFATVHPLDKPSGVQLMEITGNSSYRAWPSAQYQNDGVHFTEDKIDSPLGIYRDSKGRIWIVDMGLHLGKTRVWGFEIATGRLVKRYDVPANIAPKGSFAQDLVVDDVNGWIYLADLADPGIIALNMATGESRRFGHHPSLEKEPGVAMVIDQVAIQFNGKPAEVAIDPITLSHDRETLYYGAMNGHGWYAVPAKLFRSQASDDEIAAAIVMIGHKPISDGATTDAAGNHYFTNLTEHGIDVLSADDVLTPLIRDPRLSWPDNVQFGAADTLYISVNQLHTTSAFTGGADTGKPPYLIMRAILSTQKR